MAGATLRIIAAAQWRKLIEARNRDCLVMIDARGPVEIAVSDSGPLDPSVTRGHPLTGADWMRIHGLEVIWVRGAASLLMRRMFTNCEPAIKPPIVVLQQST